MPATPPAHRSRASRGPSPWGIAATAAVGVVAAVVLALAVTNPAQPTTPSGTYEAQGEPGQPPAASQPPNPTPLPVAVPPVVPTPTVTFTFVAGGDVLAHMPVVRSAQKGSGYDFVPLMKNVAPYIKGADLAICHLETPLAPKGTKPSGYPMFGAPKQLAGDLAKVGWDGCSQASNHSVDRGFAGIEATLDEFQRLGLGHAGTARSEDESTITQMYNVVRGDRTVRVANISFTYGLNGLPKPAGKPWAVNTFDAEAANVKPILDAATLAREQGADVVIASTHCCVEYRTEPNAAQTSIVAQIAESGLVDLYVGHHAHVPQPIRKLAGGPDGAGMWAAYGLGNFLSNQSADCCVAESSNGVLLSATFTVDPSGHVDVDVGWTATTVDRRSGHTMYVMTPESGKLGSLSAAEVDARHARVVSAVGREAPEVTSPVTAAADSMSVTERTP